MRITLAALCARGVDETSAPKRGRRESRVRAAPAVSRAKLCKRAHTSIQVQRRQSGLPCAMVLTASFVLSPAIGLFVTVAGRITSANLTPASRRQDHTTSPSASKALSSEAPLAAIASNPASVTIAIRPSSGVDGCGDKVICAFGKSEYFFKGDWTGRISLIRLGKLDFTRKFDGTGGWQPGSSQRAGARRDR